MADSPVLAYEKANLSLIWLHQQLLRTYMVLLHPIDNWINLSLQIVCPQSASQFASTLCIYRKLSVLYLQVSLLLEKLKLKASEAQFFFRGLRHWWNFCTSLVDLFCRKPLEMLGFCRFSQIFKRLLIKWVTKSANFTHSSHLAWKTRFPDREKKNLDFEDFPNKNLGF